jgi:NAD(P)-dependent dehydrogenase (short-subunit alcohol dehydrogenase family)
MGEAEARLFAAEGAKVVFADIPEGDGEAVAAEIRTRGGKVIAAPLPEMPALLGSRLDFIARDNRGESSGLSEAPRTLASEATGL